MFSRRLSTLRVSLPARSDGRRTRYELRRTTFPCLSRYRPMRTRSANNRAEMPASDIARQRLINQGLVKPILKTATAVVAKLGAVQAQDYAGSKWGIAQRTAGLTDAQIEKEIDNGKIIRTHILRPTWHFVAAADIGWMLALSGPRVHAANAYWYRWLEVDDAVARRSRTALTKALRDRKELTRAELGAALRRAKIQVASSQRLACIVMRAELDGLICSGARRGKQFTYSLLE